MAWCSPGLMSRSAPPRSTTSRAIATALGQAFVDDPVMIWAIPEPDRRQAILPAFFTDLHRGVPAPRSRLSHRGRHRGALWSPPGVDAVGEDEGEEFGAALDEICGPDAGRMGEISTLLGEHHPHEPVWYLNFVGVEPAGQGRGLGSALLEHVLVRADRDGATAYLDATSTRNRALYERHGFVATGELVIPDGPTFWPMWREPRRR